MKDDKRPVEEGTSLERRSGGWTGELSDCRAILEGLRLGQVGIWRWKVDSDELQWTDNVDSIHKNPEGTFSGSLDAFQNDLHPDDAIRVWNAVRASVETGERYNVVYQSTPREDGDTIWIEASGGLVTEPDGTRYLTGTCVDVTERVRADHAFKRRLRQQQAIVRFGSYALEESNFQKLLDRAVLTASEVFDAPLVKVLELSDDASHLLLRAGVGWKDGLVGTARLHLSKESQGGYSLDEGMPIVVYDLSTDPRFVAARLLHDHGVRSGMSVVIPGVDRRPFGVLGVHTTELRSFDVYDVDFLISIVNIVAAGARNSAVADQQRLMLREMAHRAGNMLQVVNSLASQSFREGYEFEQAMHTFSQRLASLSRANYLIARGGWTSARLIALLEEVSGAFRSRIKFDGLDILLPAEFSFDFGLVVHELLTNSVRYGSLATEAGTVTLQWRLTPGDKGFVFRFSWNDPDSAPFPPAVGSRFGSKLKRSLIEKKWNGTVSVKSGNGYSFTCEVPLPMS